MYINEIFDLDEIFNYEKKIFLQKKINILNVSYWNPSDEYRNYMLDKIHMEQNNNFFNYHYTYDIPREVRQNVISKLGNKDTNSTMCLLTPSATSSIINMINFLKNNGYKKLCILEPAYFSVEQTCILFDLPYEKCNIQFINNHYVIPYKYIKSNGFDAVWITSPIYSTSTEYDYGQINVIQKLIDQNVLVIADETLALPNQELCRKIPIGKHFFCIYSPHKPLFINGIKFSAILCPKYLDDFLEQWIDVLGGGLLHSNLMAIQHFLSENYNQCVEYCIKWYGTNLKLIESLLDNVPYAFCDSHTLGAYKMLFFKSSSKNMNSLNNIFALIDKYYVSYIPGIYSGFSSDFNACFRINLSLKPEELSYSLSHILNFMLEH